MPTSRAPGFPAPVLAALMMLLAGCASSSTVHEIEAPDPASAVPEPRIVPPVLPGVEEADAEPTGDPAPSDNNNDPAPDKEDPRPDRQPAGGNETGEPGDPNPGPNDPNGTRSADPPEGSPPGHGTRNATEDIGTPVYAWTVGDYWVYAYDSADSRTLTRLDVIAVTNTTYSVLYRRSVGARELANETRIYARANLTWEGADNQNVFFPIKEGGNRTFVRGNVSSRVIMEADNKVTTEAGEFMAHRILQTVTLPDGHRVHLWYWYADDARNAVLWSNADGTVFNRLIEYRR